VALPFAGSSDEFSLFKLFLIFSGRGVDSFEGRRDATTFNQGELQGREVLKTPK
jgi:hypothetical protein